MASKALWEADWVKVAQVAVKLIAVVLAELERQNRRR